MFVRQPACFSVRTFKYILEIRIMLNLGGRTCGTKMRPIKVRPHIWVAYTTFLQMRPVLVTYAAVFGRICGCFYFQNAYMRLSKFSDIHGNSIVSRTGENWKSTIKENLSYYNLPKDVDLKKKFLHKINYRTFTVLHLRPFWTITQKVKVTY